MITASLRLFICIEIEDDLLRETLTGILSNKKFTMLKRARKDQMHLTLKFLGDTDKATFDEVIKELETINFAPFRVEMKGMGCFPGTTKPRIVWVGVEEGKEGLISLANEIDGKMNKIGYKKEKRSYQPHLTIARVKKADLLLIKDLQHLVLSNSDTAYGSFKLSKIILKKSTLTPSGPIYENLLEINAREE